MYKSSIVQDVATVIVRKLCTIDRYVVISCINSSVGFELVRL